METMTWGLLGPEKIESVRRARSLGVAAAVRAFNDLAVPGLGGVWFGKQIVLATLGVYLAEKVSAKHSNIKVANAVEALACGLGLALLKNNQIEPHHRALLRASFKISSVLRKILMIYSRLCPTCEALLINIQFVPQSSQSMLSL